MNCAECRENLVAFVEGLLEREESLQCQTHLESCAACRAEHTAITRLQRQLVARGQTTAEVSLAEPVMRRVRGVQTKPERNTIMSLLLKNRWGFGLGAAAGVAAIVISIFVVTSPKAFGIEQVIEAYSRIHFLHVKVFKAKAQAPAEFWIQSDGRGRVARARYYLPETEDGAKLITWTPERSEIWFQGKRRYQTFQTRRIAPWMQSLLEQSQPQALMQQLLEDQKAGKIGVDIREPADKQAPAVIVVTHKNKPKKEIYWIDRKTDLITRIEHYRLSGTNEVLSSKTEFRDYNAPIEERMFSIRGELPKEVRIADQINQVVGVAQGNMTDEQAATETVRQFFQALMDKDYRKVGLLVCGELEEYAKEEYGAINITRIISIGSPVAQPDWDKHGFRVPCELEIVNADGQRVVWKPGPYVRPGDDEMYPDHWNITGGVNAGETAIKILPDNEKYARMTAKQAAEAFFEACGREDWNEAQKFWTTPLDERIKQNLGGLEIVSLGEAFTSRAYSGRFVPYEIKFKDGHVQKHNLAVRNDNPTRRWVVDGGI